MKKLIHKNPQLMVLRIQSQNVSINDRIHAVTNNHLNVRKKLKVKNFKRLNNEYQWQKNIN